MSLEEYLALPTGDRGKAKYFHGRHAEIASFQHECNEARRHGSGTCILIQGPPGSGKTALLEQFAAIAKADGWHTASIAPAALHDPQILAEGLEEAYAVKAVRHSEGGGSLGLSTLISAAGQFTKGKSEEYSGVSVFEMLRRAAGSRGLILILDEMQALRIEVKISPEVRSRIIKTLAHIHNGAVKAPIMLLAGGLGTSKAILGKLEISRFKDGCLWNLGSLSDSESFAVIEDWLVQTGGASSSDHRLEHWISELAAGCHNWPQHLHVYGCVAARWLEIHDGELTGVIPPVVLETSQAKRRQYYENRLADFRMLHRRKLSSLVGRKKRYGTLELDELISALTAPPPYSPLMKYLNSCFTVA